MTCAIYRAGCLAGLLAVNGIAGAAVLTFETPGEYAANFRAYPSSGQGATVSQSSNGADNDYVIVDRTVGEGATALVALYDTTPDDPNDAWNTFSGGTITVTWEVMAVSNDTSFAVIFVNPETTGSNKNAMAILNVRATDMDIIRFFPGNPLTGTGAGSPQRGTTVSGHAVPMSEFITMTVSYTPATGEMFCSAGSLSASATFTESERLAIGDNVAIALRVNDTNAAAGSAPFFDNVTIVPEPGLLGLLRLSGLLIARRRWA